MSAFELSWHLLKAGPMPDWSSTDRGYDEDPQFDNPIDRPEDYPDEEPRERVDAPTLDSNHILRLTKPQLDKLIRDAQNEIQRRDTKRADKRVAVVDSPVKEMANADEWIKHKTPWGHLDG